MGRRKIPGEMFKTGFLIQMLYTAWVPIFAAILLIIWLFTRSIPLWLPFGVLALWPILALVNQLRFSKRLLEESSETEFGQLLDDSLNPAEGKDHWRSRVKEDVDKKIRAACYEDIDFSDEDK